ncbi:Large-conductance mechanosensitive channel [Euzebya pacifica]|uniref:Large-conductance mechanosensitive channel n=1 Tax=Euzebya pacifica TaxID=1608957 RepID=A0A346XXJ7_9ACTN|nr:Large-conductance mechanosensitive channel [Euzebya pacifica]
MNKIVPNVPRIRLLDEFKEFALRGNVVDLAVGVVIGAAFNAVVQSFANDVLLNLVAAVFGKPDFSWVGLDRQRCRDRLRGPADGPRQPRPRRARSVPRRSVAEPAATAGRPGCPRAADHEDLSVLHHGPAEGGLALFGLHVSAGPAGHPVTTGEASWTAGRQGLIPPRPCAG